MWSGLFSVNNIGNIQKENDNIKVANCQFKSFCEIQKAFMETINGTLISCSCRINSDKQLAPDLIIRMQELQNKVHVKPYKSSIENETSLQKKCETLKLEMQILRFTSLDNLIHPDSPAPSQFVKRMSTLALRLCSNFI